MTPSRVRARTGLAVCRTGGHAFDASPLGAGVSDEHDEDGLVTPTAARWSSSGLEKWFATEDARGAVEVGLAIGGRYPLGGPEDP